MHLFLITTGEHSWPSLDDPFESQNQRKFCESHFRAEIQICAYSICLICKGSFTRTIPNGSPSLLSHVFSWIPYWPGCCIRWCSVQFLLSPPTLAILLGLIYVNFSFSFSFSFFFFFFFFLEPMDIPQNAYIIAWILFIYKVEISDASYSTNACMESMASN